TGPRSRTRAPRRSARAGRTDPTAKIQETAMNSKLVLRSALTCAILAAGAAALSMQEKKAAPAGGGQAADPMMAKWMEFASPGAAHKVLDPKVGKWTLK